MKWITLHSGTYQAKAGEHIYRITSRGSCHVLIYFHERQKRETLCRGTVSGCKHAAIRHWAARQYVDLLLRKYVQQANHPTSTGE